MTFFQDFLRFVKASHPLFSEVLSTSTYAPLCVSPAVVPLPRSVYDQLKTFVALMYRLRQSSVYQHLMLGQAPQTAHYDPGHYSVYTSFDFYLTDSGPKLIEINTNGAGALISHLLARYHGLRQPDDALFFETVRHMFEEEMGGGLRPVAPRQVLILDEQPESLATYFDMQMHQLLFESWGWPATIADVREFSAHYSDKAVVPAPDSGLPFPSGTLVYNRYCDFYLEHPDAAPLKEAYLAGKLCLTPNPHEYALLADKEVMYHLSDGEVQNRLGLSADEQELVSALIPPIQKVNPEEAEQLWEGRKQLFFKPMRSYGSKAVYKGKSITTSTFLELVQKAYIAQPYFEAPVLSVPSDDGQAGEFKYDIRVFAYKGNVQLVAARLFQGQVTNFRTPGGGFAAVAVTE